MAKCFLDPSLSQKDKRHGSLTHLILALRFGAVGFGVAFIFACAFQCYYALGWTNYLTGSAVAVLTSIAWNTILSVLHTCLKRHVNGLCAMFTDGLVLPCTLVSLGAYFFVKLPRHPKKASILQDFENLAASVLSAIAALHLTIFALGIFGNLRSQTLARSTNRDSRGKAATASLTTRRCHYPIQDSEAVLHKQEDTAIIPVPPSASIAETLPSYRADHSGPAPSYHSGTSDF